MAKSVTLAQLRSDARLYSDQRPGGTADVFITDAEVNRLINLAVGEFYDLIVKHRGADHFSASYTRSAVANDTISGNVHSGRYALPTDFYQLSSLTAEWATTEHEQIHEIPSMGGRTELLNHGAWGRFTPKGYRIRGLAPTFSDSVLEIIPKPTTEVTLRLQYIPAFTTLVNDADTLDGVNGWERLISLRVAVEIREIESDPSPGLRMMYEAERERIERMVSDRSNESPPQIIDCSPEGNRWNNSWLRLGKAT